MLVVELGCSQFNRFAQDFGQPRRQIGRVRVTDVSLVWLDLGADEQGLHAGGEPEENGG